MFLTEGPIPVILWRGVFSWVYRLPRPEQGRAWFATASYKAPSDDGQVANHGEAQLNRTRLSHSIAL